MQVNHDQLQEMETKLENTVMGNLMFDTERREKLRTMTNQDEQVDITLK